MVVVDGYAGRRVAVLGLARSGEAAARALLAGGAAVFAWDDNERLRQSLAGEIPMADPAGLPWREVAALVLSPGIPHSFPAPHPATVAARAAGVPIIGDIELLGRAQPQARYIGITGTNGKSTTTALVGHILAAAGHQVEIGGNLGTPALALAALGSRGTYVLEASSFQLELIESLRFDIAVLLNITPDHLDRHGDMAGYVAAKRRIFAGQDSAARAVIGVDDPICRDIYAELKAGPARIIPISAVHAAPGGVYAEAGWLFDATGPDPMRVLDLATAERLPGTHNWQNAAAAYAVSRAAGVAREVAASAIRSFPGLAHRQELVGIVDGVRYINDSKATNADAAEKALACYQGIHWIAGGLPKAGGIISLAPYFGRIRHTYLIGTATEEFAATLGTEVPFSRCGNLAVAIAAATERARAEAASDPVVLLSPACASYDQFANFEARGDAFRSLVQQLAGAAPTLASPACGGGSDLARCHASGGRLGRGRDGGTAR